MHFDFILSRVFINMSASDKIKASVKALEGPNVHYDKAAKSIYYSPNRSVPRTALRNVVQDNLPELHKAAAQFKADFPGQKVNIVRV